MAEYRQYRYTDRNAGRNSSVTARNTYRTGGHMEYISGSAARQLEAQPRPKKEYTPQRQVRHQRQPEPVQMPEIHKASMGMILLAMVAICTICIMYISAENHVQQQKNTIVQMQSELADMKENNQIEYQDIVDSVDLSEVYRRATEDLGMVSAKKNQVYTYENKESDMVKQYGEIPGAK